MDYGISIDLLKEMLLPFAGKLVIVVPTLIAASFVIKMVDLFLGRLFRKTDFDETLEKFIHKSVKLVLWLVTFGLVLVILGVDVSAVIASFGILGFVVGFALKDTLGNLASGVMILVNKPFLVGDIIEVKGVKGRVKTVSMSNTKLITEDNIKVVIPNTILSSEVIRNHTAYKGQETMNS